ncbi:N-acetylmuramoyl-L-alanine amidase [Streptomyces sp. NPDC048057]|uniref:N-acetylmuramoyl-L-alanine amidase n=1 Tax=Streptomyces sp. NPDC048057 TaxID=3155628 RepID=UPI0033EC5FC9
MPLVTRAQLGWPASAAAAQTSTRGVKIHYEGTAVSTKLADDHQLCLAEWKNIRRAHLADKTQGYSDVAYNYAACVHGYLLEGRGLRRRTGANGNAQLNRDHFAIVALIGSKGLTQPTDALLHALRDGIELLREHGAGLEVRGHRDGYATACPGDALYDWVERGAPRPGGSDPVPPAKPGTRPPAKPVVDLSRLIAAAKSDPPRRGTPVSYYGTKTVETALVAEKLLARELADGHYGTATVRAYAAWQRRCGYAGKDADGIPGAESLKKLGAKRGFTITP